MIELFQSNRNHKHVAVHTRTKNGKPLNYCFQSIKGTSIEQFCEFYFWLQW